MRRAALALVAVLAACGPKNVFRLSQDENNAYALKEVLARRKLPAAPAPINGWAKPRVFALAAGAPRSIVAYDLEASAVLWQVEADVQSRIWVGGDFIVDIEGGRLVARDQARGTLRWKVPLAGELVGVAADRERAYVVTQRGMTWQLSAHEGASGKQVWTADANGQLGAPVAQGGIVYVPYLRQWMSLVDARTGDMLTRIRGIDEQISALRATSQVVYYGSRQGVFRLDERSARGARADATYGHVPIPPQLDRTSYARDAYDPVQLGYSASDRARVLFSSEPTTTGPMKLTGNGYAIHYFRYVFGFDTAGAMQWAYSNPRADFVASEHTGSVLVGLSTSGEIVAIDPVTGAVRGKQSLGLTVPVLGGTFDADGWAPSATAGEQPPVATIPALVHIARDRDARFGGVKELAVATLAKMQGATVTGELLAVLADERAPQKLKDTVVALLVARKDPASLGVLAKELEVKPDYLARTEPEHLGAIAKAIAGLEGARLPPADVAPVVAALAFHLEAPSTQNPDVIRVIAALAAIGGPTERAALASHFLLYRVDDDRGDDPAWQQAIVTALATKGGAQERAMLRYAAADPRTRPGIVQLVRETLGD
ncbi:MAG TPA: PQQ-binding-like beta-propeller repeat protein [Kofleriaceae bacterium]|nr:PQQ-binding-like beta-propeller repeat protein [Kofleriaceae bacterium]